MKLIERALWAVALVSALSYAKADVPKMPPIDWSKAPLVMHPTEDLLVSSGSEMEHGEEYKVLTIVSQAGTIGLATSGKPTRNMVEMAKGFIDGSTIEDVNSGDE